MQDAYRKNLATVFFKILITPLNRIEKSMPTGVGGKKTWGVTKKLSRKLLQVAEHFSKCHPSSSGPLSEMTFYIIYY